MSKTKENGIGNKLKAARKRVLMTAGLSAALLTGCTDNTQNIKQDDNTKDKTEQSAQKSQAQDNVATIDFNEALDLLKKSVPPLWSKGMTVVKDGKETPISLDEYIAMRAKEGKVSQATYRKVHYGDADTHGKPLITQETYEKALLKLKQNNTMDKFSGITEEQVIVNSIALFAHQRKANESLVANKTGEESFAANQHENAIMYNFIFGNGKSEDIDAATAEHVKNAQSFIKATGYRMVRMTSLEQNDEYGKGSTWEEILPTVEEVEAPEPEMPIIVPLHHMPHAKVEEPDRHFLTKNVSDHWNNAQRQHTISDVEAEQMIDKQERLAKHSEKDMKDFMKHVFDRSKNR